MKWLHLIFYIFHFTHFRLYFLQTANQMNILLFSLYFHTICLTNIKSIERRQYQWSIMTKFFLKKEQICTLCFTPLFGKILLENGKCSQFFSWWENSRLLKLAQWCCNISCGLLPWWWLKMFWVRLETYVFVLFNNWIQLKLLSVVIECIEILWKRLS